ncbi:hypothetical protein EMCRGX_G004088 [Ephydatia muelleri]
MFNSAQITSNLHAEISITLVYNIFPRLAFIRAMSFRCQRDSYMQTLNTRVVSCEPSKNGESECYEAVLEDTILFPEGGGQADDRGKINGVDVLRVTRRGSKAVHLVKSPLQVDSEAVVELDWRRRFDHMQQHTGQHLITAIADKEFGFKTKSWHLSIGVDSKCYVELGTASLSKEQLDRIEEVSSRTQSWRRSDAEGCLMTLRDRRFRVVEIEGIDINTCCGTHVSNLNHLQCIKLVSAEAKKGGSTLLYYLSGDRVRSYLESTIANERAITKLLSAGADDHVAFVGRLVKERAHLATVVDNQLKELAQLLAFQHLHSNDPVDPVATIHRNEGDNMFMNLLAKELTPKGVMVMVTVGGNRGAGQFLLAGEEAAVATLGPQVAALLEGKGGGRKGVYQGKAAALERREEVYTLIRDFKK